MANAEKERLAATAAVEQRVNGLQRAQFHWILRRAQRFMLARDNGQHYLVKLMLPVRRLYATLAARWAARGWLGEADDFFFLVVEEVEAVLAQTLPGCRRPRLQYSERRGSRRGRLRSERDSTSRT